jgi:ABC-type glycerol-3-phosphate transport system permease component
MRRSPNGAITIKFRPTITQLFATVAVLINTLPLYWMMVTSFKSSSELYRGEPSWLPAVWTLENYHRLFFETRFPTYFANSVTIAVVSTAVAILLGSFSAYALSRFQNGVVVAFGRIILGTKTLPTVLIALPLYLYMVRAGLVNTKTSLILANISFTLPITIWLLKPHIDAVPAEIEESAWLDGCSRVEALFRVVLPSALPGIVSVAVINFTAVWNEYLFALIFISSDQNKTLPLGLSVLVGQDSIDSWGLLMAASVLVCGPVIALYALAQRQLVSGLMEGSVKG